jgi:hypothetical protein
MAAFHWLAVLREDGDLKGISLTPARSAIAAAVVAS